MDPTLHPVLNHPAAPPAVAVLRALLGETSPLWAAALAALQSAHGPLQTEWKRYGKASGWVHLVKQGKRTLLYLCPQEGGIVAIVVLGEKAAAEALASPTLPDAVKALVRNAKPYVEGRSVRLPLDSGAAIDHLLTLVAAKLA